MHPGSLVPAATAARGPAAPRLQPLLGLAPAGAKIWSRIDRETWTRHRNPIPVLSGPVDWARLLDDTTFIAEVRDVLRDFDRYMANGSDNWFQRQYPDAPVGPIAYFCAEYGFYESLGIYSGGLGCLPATTPRRRPTWRCPSSASGCCTATATSTRRSTPTATRSTPTPTTT